VTLVLTCVAPTFVVQVADRRTTYPDGSVGEDEFNKSLFLCGQAVVSFTGPAQVDGESTIAWARERVVGEAKDLGDRLEALQAAATDRFVRQPGTSREHRAAFVVAGIGSFRTPGGVVLARDLPFIHVISNCLDRRGQWLRTAKDRFTVFPVLLDGRPFRIVPAGQPPTAEESRGLHRDVRRALERGGGAGAVARLLALQVRDVAERNGRVGKNLLCAIIPRSAAGTGEMSIAYDAVPPGGLPDAARFQSPDPASATYIYLPEDPTQLVFYGPEIACDEARITNLRYEAPSKEGESLTVTLTAWDASSGSNASP
jgi:hypothetical protein